MKKALALVLAVVLAFGMAAVSFADDKYDVKVNGLDGARVVVDKVDEWAPEIVNPSDPVYFFLTADVSSDDKLFDSNKYNIGSVTLGDCSMSGLDVDYDFSLVDVEVKAGTFKAVKFELKEAVYPTKPVELTLKIALKGNEDDLAVPFSKEFKVKVGFADADAEEGMIVDNGSVVVFDKNRAAGETVTLWLGDTDAVLNVVERGQNPVYLEWNREVYEDLRDSQLDTNFDYWTFVGNSRFIQDAVIELPGEKDWFVYSVSHKDDKVVYTKRDAKYNEKTGRYELTLKDETLDGFVLADKEIKAGSSNNNGNNTDNPNTGANDVVGVAAVFAVVSLAAAGAVAFKKASK